MRILLALIAVCLASSSPAPSAAGRLLNTTGTWVRENPSDPQIRHGMVVYAGERFRLAKGDAGSFAEFMLYSGTFKKCLPNETCEIPEVEKPSSRFFLLRLFEKTEPPPPVAFAIARGTALNDAVLLLQNGQLDLRAALESLDAARYRIVLRNLRRDEAPVEFDDDWQPRNPRPVTVAVTPGLFELTVITPERAELGPAVVYVANAQVYSGAQRSLQDAQAAIAAAVPPLSEIARRQLVLAVLHSQP